MSSYAEGETFRYLKPELKEDYKQYCSAFQEKEKLPEVEYEYFFEEYMRAWGFSWNHDIVRLIQKDNAMELRRAQHSIMDWTDTEGGVHREDGRDVPYVGCTTREGKTCASISYDNIEWVSDYTATQYNFKTKKKKIFKMVEVSEQDMDESDLRKFKKEIFTEEELQKKKEEAKKHFEELFEKKKQERLAAIESGELDPDGVPLDDMEDDLPF